MPAKARRDRTYPQVPYVFSTNFPEGFRFAKGKCFVELSAYRKLEKKYLWALKRLENKNG